MSRVPTACKDCGRPALVELGRCPDCHRIWEAKRNASPRRQAYRDPRYLAQPKSGICALCGKPGANSRHHIYGLSDLRTVPAHIACHAGIRDNSSVRP